MAAPTPGVIVAAFNEAVSASVAADYPVFTEGDVVYRRADMPADGSDAAIPATKYTVRAVHVKPFAAGADGWNDQLDDDATSADGTSTRAVPGFDHVATPTGVETATPVSRPWFYLLEDGTGKTIKGIHQTQITDLAGWKAFADTKNDAVWT